MVELINSGGFVNFWAPQTQHDFSKRAILVLILFLQLCLLITLSSAFAAGNSSSGPKREKVIDFDDEMVEGMNKRPLDSLSQISERDRKRKKPHLYRKRVGFRTETLTSLEELRYAQ